MVLNLNLKIKFGILTVFCKKKILQFTFIEEWVSFHHSFSIDDVGWRIRIDRWIVTGRILKHSEKNISKLKKKLYLMKKYKEPNHNTVSTNRWHLYVLTFLIHSFELGDIWRLGIYPTQVWGPLDNLGSI